MEQEANIKPHLNELWSYKMGRIDVLFDDNPSKMINFINLMNLSPKYKQLLSKFILSDSENFIYINDTGYFSSTFVNLFKISTNKHILCYFNDQDLSKLSQHNRTKNILETINNILNNNDNYTIPHLLNYNLRSLNKINRNFNIDWHSLSSTDRIISTLMVMRLVDIYELNSEYIDKFFCEK